MPVSLRISVYFPKMQWEDNRSGRHERGTPGSGLEFSVRWFPRYPSWLLLHWVRPGSWVKSRAPRSCRKQRHTDKAIGEVAIQEAQPPQEAWLGVDSEPFAHAVGDEISGGDDPRANQ
jgi:hypothetical protein